MAGLIGATGDGGTVAAVALATGCCAHDDGATGGADGDLTPLPRVALPLKIDSMPTYLIRCSLHQSLSHDAFGAWIRQRRDDLVEGSVIEDLRAAALNDASWVLGVDVPGASGPTAAKEIRALIGDLRLLGLRPSLYRPVTGAASASL
jgi:hypothetical protein